MYYCINNNIIRRKRPGIWHWYIYLDKDYCKIIVQELCESRGGRPGLAVLTSLLASVDVKIY